MGLRFRRTLRILPGLRLNVSKSGASVSMGGRGVTVNVGSRGTRYTVGLPGSGMSYSVLEPHRSAAQSGTRRRAWRWLLLAAAVVAIALLLKR